MTGTTRQGLTDALARCPNRYCDGTGWVECEKEGRRYRLPACKVGPHSDAGREALAWESER